MSHDQCRRFYDRFGEKQDQQTFYEQPAIDQLIEHGRFIEAHTVFEFGGGTDKFAGDLLAKHFPLTARYVGVDISTTMIQIARSQPALLIS